MQLSQQLIDQIHHIVSSAREQAIRSVDLHRVKMYWQIGKVILEEEQQGQDRAVYGDFLIRSLSDRFQPLFGSGFSKRQLERYRQFYRCFPIASALRTQFTWTHYRALLSIENQPKRDFYIAESENNNWTARQLERQIKSQLFERLLVGNDLEKMLAVARKEKQPYDPREIIKDPMILEFLDIQNPGDLYERDFEQAVITHMQQFLLEMGNGFSFIGRQKRIHLEGDDFFIDLLFYNRMMQCFVVIEIKTTKLTHEDLGKLQMYVNYFDRFEKQDHENPTIGILLCADKNDAVVKITLPENNKQIFASKYQLYLPSEQQLLEEVRKEMEKLKD